MRENVKFAAGVIETLVSLLLPVLIIVWYTMEHRLPRIGPFEEGSSGSSFLCGLPIILSEYVPFTHLSIAAIIVIIVHTYYGVRMEEKKLDIPKWGDEYLQYMKEVSRFNFIKGLLNLRKREN